MDFRILGPLEASDEGGRIALGGSKQRALLAVLLLHANETLTADRLIDELWGEEPPATAAKTIQVYVHRLRKTLAAGEGGSGSEILVTRENGYELQVDPELIDASRFQRLAGEGRAALAAGDAKAAADVLESGLALWRGEPLAEFAYEPFARREIERLGDLRVDATEQLIDAKLALGRHAEVIRELESLIAEYPYREGLRAQLMLALYRSERQAEALQAYQNARKTLVDELGIEPGERLHDLEGAILAHDPGLALPATEAPLRADTVGQTGVSAPPAEPAVREAPAPASARRLVSIVFADLVGSTGLAERLDPEAMHALLDRYTELCSEVIERHGGSVEGFIGDAVVGVFGQAEIHEDDALRAVRVAVELRQACSALSAELERELGVPIGVKLGVEAGEVFVSPGVRRTRFAAGDAFNVAARLEGLASDGEILLGEKISELVRDQVRMKPLEPIALKGRDAKVQPARLVELMDDPAPFGPVTSPLVDRAGELTELRSAFDRACLGQTCQALTVAGPAGIGKSRLARELVGEIRETASVAVGRCLSYGEEITFQPLVEIVGQLCGPDPQEPIAALLEEDDDSKARLVLQAIGLAEGHAQVEETFWAVRTLLERIAVQRPLVLAVDDVHWAEPLMLDLLDYLVAFSSGYPILLVCLARPEIAEIRPGWTVPQPNRSFMLLDRLPQADAKRLVEAAGLDPGAEARIVEMGEGNPLFLEQLVAMGVEDDDSALPSSIQAVLAARIDRLGEGERAVLEHASVQGRTFYIDAVADLLPDTDRAGIAMHVVALVHKQLVRSERSDLQGEDAFRFSHALVREVAYEGLPKGRRAELHERLARWVEARPGARDETVGFHLSEAYRNLAALGPVGEHERALAAEARDRLISAAEAARVRGDPGAGARLLERAETLVDADDLARGELLPLLGAALYEAGRLDDAARVLDEAIERAPQERLRARAQVEREHVRLEMDLDTAMAQAARVSDDVLAVLESEDDHRGQCRAWLLRGEVAWIAGQAEDAEDRWARAAECAQAAGEKQELFEVVGWRALGAALGPVPVDDAIRRCEALGELVGDSPIATASVLNPLALLHAMKGEPERSEKLLAETKEILEALGGLGSGFSHLEAWSHLGLGRPEPVEARLRADADKLASMHAQGALATTTALLAQVVFAQDRVDEAGELSAAAAQGAASEDVLTQLMWRIVAARVGARQGRTDEAEALAREAVALAEGTDLISHRADAMLALADVLSLSDRTEEADRSARAGLALYEEKGNVAAAAETQAFLQRLQGGP